MAGSTEGEGLGPHAWIQEIKGKGLGAVRAVAQPHQLVEPVLLHQAMAPGIGVIALGVPRGCAVDAHLEAHGPVAGPGAEHQMQVKSAKAVGNPSPWASGEGFFSIDRPGARQTPLVEGQISGQPVTAQRRGQQGTRGKSFRPIEAQVGLNSPGLLSTDPPTRRSKPCSCGRCWAA